MIIPQYFRFDILTSSNSISHDVLIVSRSSEYFHLDKSYFCLPCAACTDLTNSDLKHHLCKKITTKLIIHVANKVMPNFSRQKCNYLTAEIYLKLLNNGSKSLCTLDYYISSLSDTTLSLSISFSSTSE